MNSLNEKDGSLKQLKINSALVILLAATAMSETLLSLFSEEFMNSFKELGAAANAFTGIFAVIAVVIFLIQFWIGFQGIRYSNGKGKGESHIFLARVFLVIFGIGFISSVMNLVNGQGFSVSILSDFVKALVMYCYLTEAKKCLE